MAVPERDDTRALTVVMHTAFFVLLSASVARYLARHADGPHTPWVIALSLLLAALYVLGPALGVRPTPRRLTWLGLVVAAWALLVVLAPSFAWCAVPLFYTGLRTLPPRAAIALVALLTVLAVAAQLSLAGWPDPNVLLAPPAVAAVATTVFVVMQRQAARRDALIDDLVRTRRELAATERREGTLAERERLAREIHDTLAQGLSSQRMLLQAADRLWDTAPGTARDHVRTAAAIAERSLAEARRFVHDLTPADLAEGGGLLRALHAVAERETTPTLTVRVHSEGSPPSPLPGPVESALLRIAQGALANVREHAAATTATLTLTCLDDQIVLDVTDDGRGFDPHTPPTPEADPPSTAAPGTAAPGTDAPGTDAPGADAPDTATAGTAAPGTAAPGTDAPGTDAPGTDAPDTATAGTAAPGAPAAHSRGHGLPAIRARLRQLGGTLTIESAPGRGTALSASIPLEPK